MKKEKEKAKKISEKEYQELQEQLAQEKDKYIRLLADFENARKRQERERVEFVKYANEKLLTDFLNVVDDLERTVVVAREKHQDYDSFLKGVEMVMKHVVDLLKKQGVEPIDPVEVPFDPYAHEILQQEPTSDYVNGMVIESLQKGYKVGDRVIRTAKVKVAINVTGDSGAQEVERNDETDQDIKEKAAEESHEDCNNFE